MNNSKEQKKEDRTVTWKDRGERLRELRIIARLQRNQAAQLAGYTETSYKMVELGNNNLTAERAAWFVNAVKDMGIDVTVEWLLYGIGSKPKKNNVSMTLDSVEKTNELDQVLITKELDYFCRNHPNSISLIIPDDSMAPLYFQGDVVAGENHNKKDSSKFLGQNCLVTLTNGTVMLRNLNPGRKGNLFTLLSLNPHAKVKILSDMELQNIAPILWHRRQNKWRC